MHTAVVLSSLSSKVELFNAEKVLSEACEDVSIFGQISRSFTHRWGSLGAIQNKISSAINPQSTSLLFTVMTTIVGANDWELVVDIWVFRVFGTSFYLNDDSILKYMQTFVFEAILTQVSSYDSWNVIKQNNWFYHSDTVRTKTAPTGEGCATILNWRVLRNVDKK